METSIDPVDGRPDRDEELEPEAELVALRLAAGDGHAAAALSIGRSAKWVQRRLTEDPRFRRRVLELKAARVEQAAAGLGNLLDRAVAAVADGLDSERPADRLHAARLVLDRFRLFRGDVDLVDELADLRSQISDLQKFIDARDGGRS
jgi:hypothetical protein